MFKCGKRVLALVLSLCMQYPALVSCIEQHYAAFIIFKPLSSALHAAESGGLKLGA
jgi:hypothetical protein